MIDNYIDNQYDLIQKMLSLQKLGYIFRGHANAIWRPLSSIFRSDGQKKLTEEFPIQNNIIDWYFSEEIKEIVRLWAKIRIENTIPSGLRRIFDLYSFIMKYNYSLNKFILENPDSEDENKSYIPQRDWGNEETFINFVENGLQNWLAIYNLDGSLRSRGVPFEDLTILEEAFPQHYGFKTTALDFSKNPLKALHFALDKNYSGCFSMLAYKQTDEINSPTKIIENSNLKNIRAIKQEGCFVYFTRPCSHYVHKNKFPSLFDCDKDTRFGSGKYFQLERIIVPKTPEILKGLLNILKVENINKQTLELI